MSTVTSAIWGEGEFGFDAEELMELGNLEGREAGLAV